MRVTIGGLIVLSLVAGGGAIITLNGSAISKIWTSKKAEPAKTSVSSLTQLFDGEESKMDAIEPSLVDVSTTTSTAMGVEETLPADQNPFETAPIIPTETTQPIVANVTEAASPPVVKKVKRRRSTRKSKRKVTTEAVSPQKNGKTSRARRTSSSSSLVGAYVSLTLKTGREVKGILESITPTNYTLQLPGMGPFDYPADTVASVKKAE